MKALNVNTVRIFNDFTDEELGWDILDEFYEAGIYVVLTVANSIPDIDSGRYLETVRRYKKHPAILMWSVGNEWNLNLLYQKEATDLKSVAGIVNRAAASIKALDPHHAVTSSLGDGLGGMRRLLLEDLTAIDVWGLNLYRGESFGTLFEDWKAKWGEAHKPFYLAEFGTDSCLTVSYQAIVRPDGKVLADDVQCCRAGERCALKYCDRDQDGFEDWGCDPGERMQADVDLRLWNEIKRHQARLDEEEQCVGGFVHEFNDELWKVGNYHVGLGGLIDYDSENEIEREAFRFQNAEGSRVIGGHPDHVANEEYFGLMTADRRPKAAYAVLAAEFAGHTFLRGDADCDGSVNIDDVFFMLNFLYHSGLTPECLDAADMNDDGRIDQQDPAALLLEVGDESRSAAVNSLLPQEDFTADNLTCLRACGAK